MLLWGAYSCAVLYTHPVQCTCYCGVRIPVQFFTLTLYSVHVIVGCVFLCSSLHSPCTVYMLLWGAYSCAVFYTHPVQCTCYCGVRIPVQFFTLTLYGVHVIV